MKVLITTDLYATSTNGVVTSVRNLMYEAQTDFCELLDTILQNPDWCRDTGTQSAQIADAFEKRGFAEK